ncbi:SH3 domain-containing protein [Pararhizobium polonicum]|uniref:SH3 domain-containing protein n=1 Tax=Pararhizobium polonicum TaxID=1612624 RepID=UPI001876ABE9|nr:SH3 domain-containing protein [Pararhizobium polonicum]
MKSIVTVGIAAVTLFAAAAQSASGADCIVADPTATPLNVRAEPQGRVLSVLGNGTAVQVVEERAHGGKRWAKVARNGKALGWVFAAYLDCAAADGKSKSAPMHPRTPPP